MEYRGFTPLQKLFSFIQYDDNSISNHEQWYDEIMDKCSQSNINNEDDYIEEPDNDDKNNIIEVNYDVEEERIIILMNIVKKVKSKEKISYNIIFFITKKNNIFNI